MQVRRQAQGAGLVGPVAIPATVRSDRSAAGHSPQAAATTWLERLDVVSDPDLRVRRRSQARTSTDRRLTLRAKQAA
jgi:hypothetical protein